MTQTIHPFYSILFHSIHTGARYRPSLSEKSLEESHLGTCAPVSGVIAVQVLASGCMWVRFSPHQNHLGWGRGRGEGVVYWSWSGHAFPAPQLAPPFRRSLSLSVPGIDGCGGINDNAIMDGNFRFSRTRNCRAGAWRGCWIGNWGKSYDPTTPSLGREGVLEWCGCGSS